VTLCRMGGGDMVSISLCKRGCRMDNTGAAGSPGRKGDTTEGI